MAGDYAAQAFTQLSSTFLPVLVVSLLGAEQGAYFLPAQTAFAAMGMLATAITSSLVVEAARDEQATHRLARAVLRRICVLVLPAGASSRSRRRGCWSCSAASTGRARPRCCS